MNELHVDHEVYLLPASFGQERIWFFEQMEPNTPTYNIPFIFKMKGRLDPTLLKATLLKIVEKHEVLRTTFCQVDGELLQKVSLVNPPFSFIQTSIQEMGKSFDFPTYLRNFALKPFDVSKEPLIRFELIQSEEDLHYLLINVHHSIFDAWSIDVLKNEILSIYPLLKQGRESEMEEMELQYADYASWEKERLSGDQLTSKINFWKEYLKGAPPSLQLPTDFTRPKHAAKSGNNVKFSFPEDLVAAIRKYAVANGSTPSAFFLAVFYVLLYRYSGQKDIVIGTPVANRQESFTHDLIGFFVNTMPIRSKIKPYSKFENFLKSTLKNFVHTHGYGEVPFERIVQELNPERSPNVHPLFQVMFTFHEKAPSKGGDEFEMEHEKINTQTSKFDLVLYVSCDDQTGVGEIEYDSDLFKEETVQRFIHHYIRLIEDILNDPQKPISRLAILTDEEKSGMLAPIFFPTPLSFIHEQVEKSAQSHPTFCALKDQHGEWTYSELSDRSNQIANMIHESGVDPGSIIAIQMERSKEQIAGIIGILKAGCSYLPLDPALPENRRKFILSDSQSSLLLVDRESRVQVDVPVFTTGQAVSFASTAPDLLQGSSPTDLSAYHIYTSGSTGNPKGVSISHHSLSNHIAGYLAEFPLGEGERVLHNINYSFDASMTEIFSTLMSGNTLIMSEPSRQFDVEYLADLMCREKVTRAQLFHSLIEKLITMPSFTGSHSLHYIITGGDKLSQYLVGEYYRAMGNRTPLVNVYGPTEATVASTFYICKESDTDQVIPIGRPFANYQLLVVDDHGELVPPGIPGELWIGGDGLAQGYLNNEILSERAFVNVKWEGSCEKRFYKTGDIVKQNHSGEFIFISRKDSQVKIRGFRIELGEIQHVILTIQGVQHAAVAVKHIEGEKKLFAFVVKQKDSLIDAAMIKAIIKEELPYYMVPNAIVFMDEIPVNSNGKLLVKELPFDQNDLVSQEHKKQPESLVQFALTAIWEEVLDLDDIGINEDFFDLGGHSIKVLEVVGGIRRDLKRSIPMSILFEHRTIESLAEVLEKLEVKEHNGEVVVPLHQAMSNQPPLFLIHPGGGGVMCYLSLAKELKQDVSIFGVQSVGYEGDCEPLKDIRSMAEKYVEEIRVVQPEGPYRLAGWSMGGTLSVEMARILEEMGEVCSFIGLIDAHPFNGDREVEGRQEPLMAWAQSLGVDMVQFEGMNMEAKLSVLLEKAKENKLLPGIAEVEDVKRVIKIMASNNFACDHYHFQGPVQSDLITFHCVEKDPNHFHDLVHPEDWQERTKGTVIPIEITGRHHDVVSPHHVKSLADKLNQFL
ncbi:non-ribosomal peptide synthetase [Rossellomorea marisflavi]|uniref:non-ribosomal peptide synthetase n=1 Tax=Rossellomorea marisflavi TaxID=189381 RepID=UPI00345A26EC